MTDLFGDAAGVVLALAILWLLLRLVLWTWRYNRRQMARRRRQAAYDEYMDSPEWQALRQEALERDGRRCRLCNARRGLEVHHRYYPAVMGTETVDALTTLCHPCHEGITEMLRARRGV